LSLTTVSELTKIRRTYLQALEDGDYAALPAPGYVRGYLSSYARVLGLEAGPLLAMYRSESGSARYTGLDIPQRSEAVARTGEQHAIPWGGALAVVAGMVLVALLVWGGVRLFGGRPDETPAPLPVKPNASDVSGGTAASDTAEADSSEPSKPSVVAAQPFTLRVRVSQQGASWLKISVDGATAYEGTLTGGQAKSFSVAEKAVVRIGNPDSVRITRDGTPVKIPASTGTASVTIKNTTPQ
jgi:cytoskeletal protein RodZ